MIIFYRYHNVYLTFTNNDNVDLFEIGYEQRHWGHTINAYGCDYYIPHPLSEAEGNINVNFTYKFGIVLPCIFLEALHYYIILWEHYRWPIWGRVWYIYHIPPWFYTSRHDPVLGTYASPLYLLRSVNAIQTHLPCTTEKEVRKQLAYTFYNLLHACTVHVIQWNW